jgi:hypothetical protein
LHNQHFASSSEQRSQKNEVANDFFFLSVRSKAQTLHERWRRFCTRLTAT